MAERLKVFTDVSTTSTDQVITENVVTNSATEQAVIRNVYATATDPFYSVTVSGSAGNRKFPSVTAGPGETAILDLSGTQIVDTNGSCDLTITGAGQVYHQGKMKVMLFNDSNRQFVSNTDATALLPSESVTTSQVISQSSVTNSDPSGTWHATSGFACYRSSVRAYGLMNTSNTAILYGEDGTLLLTATTFSGTTYGACTDGTYIYGKRTTSEAIIERRNVSDGADAGDLVLDTAITGQGHNQGGWFLYYGGYIYSRAGGEDVSISKINVTTGEVTTISGFNPDGNTYNAGGVITVARDGTPYLVSQDSSVAVIMNLNTDQVTTVSNGNLNTSTEYGNFGFELAPGIVGFAYNNVWAGVDLNTPTPTVTGNRSMSTDFGFSPNPNSNANASSMASFPCHLQVEYGGVPRDVTYTAYADGVKITGVS